MYGFANIADFQVNGWERCLTNVCCEITDKQNLTFKLQIKSCHEGCLTPSTGCKIPPFNDFLCSQSIPILTVPGNKATYPSLLQPAPQQDFSVLENFFQCSENYFFHVQKLNLSCLNIVHFIYPIHLDSGERKTKATKEELALTSLHQHYLYSQLIVLCFQKLISQSCYCCWEKDLIQRWHWTVGSSNQNIQHIHFADVARG